MRKNSDDSNDPFNVVVIEDDPLMRLVIAMLFEDDPRFRICWQAASAEEAQALSLVERRAIDLIVLDDVLAGETTGGELAPWLARRWPRAGVVMFTADPDRVERRSPVRAAVAKTTPELLVPVATSMVGGPPARPSAPSGDTGAVAPTAASPSTTNRRHRRRGGTRPPVSALRRTARGAAVAAALVLLVASGRGPAPASVVTELAAFVADLLPGTPPESTPSESDPHPSDTARSGEGPAAGPATPVTSVDSTPLRVPKGASVEVPASDTAPGRSGGHLPSPPRGPGSRSPVGPPASNGAPSRADPEPPVSFPPPEAPGAARRTEPTRPTHPEVPEPAAAGARRP